MFSVRIVTTDHYLAEPIYGLDITKSEFRGTEVKKVPVLRIFGATPAGQKTCMHVHGVFPYMYIPYDGTKPEERFMRQVAASLDKALNVGNGMAKANIQHVFKITLVSGIPMYGYHQKEEQFLKIYFYNPNSIKKAADLLLGGAVMNKSFQPHESHIPYKLQLFIDFNLYGMNMINVAAVKFRKSRNKEGDCDDAVLDSPDTISPDSLIGESGLNTTNHRYWNTSNIDKSLYLPDNVSRHSTCELEVDVVASDILNRLEVGSNIGTNPGLAAIWEDERQRRRDLGESSQITPQESQEHDDVVTADSENELKLRLLEIIGNQQFYVDSQSEEEVLDTSQEIDDDGTQTDISRIVPSSQLPPHLLHRQDSDSLPSSQDTIILEEAAETEPVINMESIQKVMSFSQSFSQSSAPVASTSQGEKGDKSLMDILASLADDSPECSQEDVSQIEALEEDDSIMVSKPRLPNHESIKEDEEETLEMSQIVVTTGEDEEEDSHSQGDEKERFNIEGMDDTWSASQWFSEKDEDMEEEDDIIPQFDGASDKKTDDKPKKRLGTRGPVIPQHHSHPASHSSQYHMNPYYQQNQHYSSQHQYPGNNEYSHYNNHWPSSRYNTQNVPYPNHERMWDQQNYQHNRPSQLYQSPTGNYYQDYNQQPMYHQHHQRQQQHNQHQQHHDHQNSNQRKVSSGSAENFSSAFPQGGSDYRYEAITPPPNHQEQQRQTAAQPQESSLRNLLTNSSKPYQPPYLNVSNNNRSVSRSSTHSTSSSGSYHSDLSIIKNDEGFHNSGYNQTYSDRFHRGSQMDMGSSYHEQSYHQNMSSATTPQHIPSYNNQPPQQHNGRMLSPQSYNEAYNRSRHNSQEDLFSDSASFQELNTSDCSSANTSQKAKSELKRHLIEGRYKKSPSNAFSRQSSLLGSPPPQNFTQIKSVDPSHLSSTGSTNFGSSESPREQIGGSALNNLFNLVSNVSRENVSGLNPKGMTSASGNHRDVPTTLQEAEEKQKQYAIYHGSQYSSCNTDGVLFSPQTPLSAEIHGRFTFEHPEIKVNSSESKLAKVGKKERMKQLGLCHGRIRQPSDTSRNSSYSFLFQVPTPIFKRIKLSNHGYQINSDLKIVRMHPKDARKYSLLKIGRELVKVPKLTICDIIRMQKLLKHRNIEKEIKHFPNPMKKVTVDNSTEKRIQGEAAESEEERKVVFKSDVNKALKRRSLKLNKKSNNLHARVATNMSFSEADFSHRVIDPDQGEEKGVVLKDVSLRDASDGSLTPIKSQTPVSGRSPAYCSAATEEIYSKTMDELDLNTNHKIFGGQLFCDKEPMSEVESVLSNTHSGASSRTSSRKESSDSTESLFEENDRASRPGKRRHSSANSQTSGSCRARRSSVNYTSSIYSHLMSIEEEESQFNKRRKERDTSTEKEGVHYIIVGKFKGHKSMRIRLKRTYLPRKCISASEYLANPKKFQKEETENTSLDINQLQESESSSSEMSDDEVADPPYKSSSDRQNLVPTYESSDSTHSSDSGMLSHSENVSQNISEASSEGTEVSEGSKDFKRSKRKKLTPNQRLGVAFLTTKARRKKAVSGGKLMNSLSILHQATLANLTETTPAYTDRTDDNKANYEDVMYKLALFSPPDSDKGEPSPPVPSSPTEDEKKLLPDTVELLETIAPNSPSAIKEVEVSPEEVKEKCTKPLEIDIKCVKTNVPPMTSADMIYETPLSSVETQKAEPAFSPSLASVGSSENDYNTCMPELKDETLTEDNDDADTDDFWNEDRFLKANSAPKTAVVKLATLSLSDISSLNAARKTMKEYSSSPPDLGPPNIPAYPPGLLPKFTRDISPTPPNLTPNRSPRSLETESTKVGAAADEALLKLMAYRPKSTLSGKLTSDDKKQCNGDSVGSNPAAITKINPVETKQENKKSCGLLNGRSDSSIQNCAKKSMFNMKLMNKDEHHNVEHFESFDDKSNPGNTLDCNKIVSYLTSPSDFVASNVNTSPEKSLPLPSQGRNLWTDITCAAIDPPAEDKSKHKYKKKHEMFNSCNLNSSYSTNSNNAKSNNSTDSTKDPGQPCPETDQNSTVTSVILKPLKLAPLRSTIEESAPSHGLSLANHKEAFCSNPEDIPDKSREVGGQVIRIESNLVKDLEEFTAPCDSLKNWRTILSSSKKDKLFSSQERETLWEKLEKDPQFKFMLAEDKKQVIAPCRNPPSKLQVSDWLKRQLRKITKNEKIKSGKPKEMENLQNVCENKKSDSVVEEDKINSQTCSQGKDGNVHMNDLQGKGDEGCEIATIMDVTVGGETMKADNSLSGETPETSDYSNITRADVPRKDNSIHVDADNTGHYDTFENTIVVEMCTEELLDFSAEIELSNEELKLDFKATEGSKPAKSVKITRLKRTLSGGEVKSSSQEDVEILSPSPNDKNPCTRWDQREPTSPTRHKIQDNGECDSFLHSTPVHRSAKNVPAFDLETSCTPIHVTLDRDPQITGEGNVPGMFVTPKRPAPPRRMSTNTENTLRRSILTSQMKNQLLTPDQSKGDTSQIDGPTPKNSFGFKVTQQNLKEAKALHRHQHLTVMSIELHMETRGDFNPNPEYDPIQVVFYSVFNDVPEDEGHRFTTGAIIVDKSSVADATPKKQCKGRGRKTSGRSRSVSPKPFKPRSPQPSTSTKDSESFRSRSVSPKPTKRSKMSPDSPKPSTSKTQNISPKPSTSKYDPTTPGQSTSKTSVTSHSNKRKTLLEKSGVDDLIVTYVADEEELIEEFILLVHRWDPDILVGFEIQLLSIGYILQRASHLSKNICPRLSRLPDTKEGNRFSAQQDAWGADYNSEIHIAGRIVLNLWRILKHEVTLNIYDFENVAYHVLHKRIPLYSFRSLSTWFNHRTHLYRWRVIDHYVIRVKGQLEIIDQLDLIGKTSEFARVFGIEFYDVLSRGSQYRVESMMLRLAKPMNFIPVSPSVHQRARMRAPECIPLTLEPDSKFYSNPVVVLDFQSLYPSIMIAYNYCFSTCLGRLERLTKAHEGQFEFGCTSLKLSPAVIRKLKDDVTISPNGVVFAKEKVRKGVISKMVEEILNTRIMVKKAMKDYKDDKALYRMLNARQLGLKLIANVTYGYTGANFSGRMPCIEVGDSIVRKARESLERSIKLVEETPRWGARVVYGDTDSLFIEMKGKTKDEAFLIGQEIADAVTSMFPKPMKLKFEKVYLPCVLQTKKRYVGFMYETRDQKEPVFDAKGIETVRRDNCGAVSKVLERCIKILFTTRDVSQVKQYVMRQCQKLLEGRVSLQDCVFAKEYRGMSGYKPGACVPALQIAKKRIKTDPRSEPRTGERVPYIIVYGTPGLPLIQLVREPRDLLIDPTLRLNGTYYITKQILPPLNRLFSLIGVDVFAWYQEMPKVVRIAPQAVTGGEAKKGTISQYFLTSNCPVCDEQTKQCICKNCMKDPQMVSVILCDRIRQWERVHNRLSQVCFSCMGCQDVDQPCITLDCPILFRRLLAGQDLLRGEKIRQDINKMLEF